MCDECRTLDIFNLLNNKRKTAITKQALNILTEDERKWILDNILVDQNYGYTRECLIEKLSEDERDRVIRASILDILRDENGV